MKKGLFLGLSFLSFIELVEIVMKVVLTKYDDFQTRRKINIPPKVLIKPKK